MGEEEDWRKVIEGFDKVRRRLAVSAERLREIVGEILRSTETRTMTTKGIAEDTKELDKLAEPIIEGIEQLGKWRDTK